RLVVAIEHLTVLASSTAPADKASANAVLERLQRVRREVATEPLILQRLAALLRLARIAAGVVYDASPPAPAFGGRAAWIDRETVELTYEFDAASEQADWISQPDYLQGWRNKFQEITVPEGDRKFEPRAGAWSGKGSFVFRHVLPFEAPLKINVVLRHGKAADEGADLGHFALGVCYRSPGEYAAVSERGEVFVVDVKADKYVTTSPASPTDTVIGAKVLLELTHDGEKLRYVHEGQAEPEQPTGTLRSGSVLLLVHTNRELAIESVTIRGKLGAEAQKLLRERWIAHAVEKTGLE
ncbi:MAG TPA: hypothetical protein VM509_15450, partial [Planctomycetota bacterium]|nr:hypothetical protein [Planctomycetota bacterium]